MERLFDLDFQLLHDAILTAVSVFFLFMFLSYLLFDPVHEMLKKRREKIQNDIDSAKKDREDADALKNEYEDKLKNADAEVDEILADARKRATANENHIIADAKEEAARILKRRLKPSLRRRRRVMR